MNTSIFSEALAAHKSGRLDEAESHYRCALEHEPGHADAHHNLAGILIRRGHCAEALVHLAQAIALRPMELQFHLTRFECLLRMEQLADARRALRELPGELASPKLALAWSLLGDRFNQARGFASSADCYREASRLEPANAALHNNIGSALFSAGDLKGAEGALQKALKLAPDFAAAHFNLGNVLRDGGRRIEAMVCFKRAISLDPHMTAAWLNLGNELLEAGDVAGARSAYQHVLLHDPDHVDALTNLAKLQLEQGQVTGAIELLDRVIARSPGHAIALNSLGIAWRTLGDGKKAAHYLRLAQAAQPDPRIASNILFAHAYDEEISPAEVFADHIAFADRFEKPLIPLWPQHRAIKNGSSPLRVGFVSGDLCGHPVGIFLEDVLRHIDATRIHTILYPTRAFSDATTDRLRAAANAWVPLEHLSDEAAAQRIRDDAVDILVDLSGHTAGNRLPVFARKPAPLQVTWLGYFATTGLRAMDYILCDRHVLPSEDEKYYTEKPYRLPDSYLCFSAPHETVEVGPLPALANGYMTFGCFNNLTKLNEKVVSVWAGILSALPEARLFLKARQLNDGAIQVQTRKRFAAYGIDADRLILEGSSPRSEYFAAYRRIDLALDPFPYPGGTTSVEALWMGVPVLHLRGDRFLYRLGESILSTVGLDDWIVTDEAEYTWRALERARDLPGLATIRAGLRDRLLASPLCDAKGFARNLEDALCRMWASRMTGLPPQNLSGGV